MMAQYQMRHICFQGIKSICCSGGLQKLELPDGYASKIIRCVSLGKEYIHKMKYTQIKIEFVFFKLGI